MSISSGRFSWDWRGVSHVSPREVIPFLDLPCHIYESTCILVLEIYHGSFITPTRVKYLKNLSEILAIDLLTHSQEQRSSPRNSISLDSPLYCWTGYITDTMCTCIPRVVCCGVCVAADWTVDALQPGLIPQCVLCFLQQACFSQVESQQVSLVDIVMCQTLSVCLWRDVEEGWLLFIEQSQLTRLQRPNSSRQTMPVGTSRHSPMEWKTITHFCLYARWQIWSSGAGWAVERILWWRWLRALKNLDAQPRILERVQPKKCRWKT